MDAHGYAVLPALIENFPNFFRSEGDNLSFKLWESFEQGFDGDICEECSSFLVSNFRGSGSFGKETLICCLIGSAALIKLIRHGEPLYLPHDFVDYVIFDDGEESCSVKEGDGGDCSLWGCHEVLA